jgi:sensor histidine kinase YesM
MLFEQKGDGLQLPWHQNHLSFAFKAIELSRDDAMKYRWRLEGADTEWSPWYTQNTVNYANLAPGTYRFWVQAAGSNLIAPSQAISAAFTIQKPFWQTWVFIVSTILLGVIVLLWGIRIYVQRVRSKELAQREQLELKNRLLQLEQKALQLQMNPHFIFNALNSIQSLIATQDYSVARQEITQFAVLMRGVLNNSRKTEISLQEEMDTLTHYLRVEQFCQQNPFTFEIRAGEDMEPDQIRIPPMLLQPFVENAVVHGVSHLEYPGHIRVVFSTSANSLLAQISDNGIGREKAALLREAKKPGHQSAALEVTRDRLLALGGQLTIGDGSESGTVVQVELPLNEA